MDNDYDMTIVNIKKENSDSEDDDITLATLKNVLENSKKQNKTEEEFEDSSSCLMNDFPSSSASQNSDYTNLQQQAIETDVVLSQQNQEVTKAIKCQLVDDFIIYEIVEANNTTNSSTTTTTTTTNSSHTNIKNAAQPTQKRPASTPIQQEPKKKPKNCFQESILSTTVNDTQKKSPTLLNGLNIESRLKKKLEISRVSTEPNIKPTEAYKLPTGLTVTKIAKETCKSREKPTLNDIASQTLPSTKPSSLAKPSSSEAKPSSVSASLSATSSISAAPSSKMKQIRNVASNNASNNITTSSLNNESLNYRPIRNYHFQQKSFEVKKLQIDTNIPASVTTTTNSNQEHQQQRPRVQEKRVSLPTNKLCQIADVLQNIHETTTSDKFKCKCSRTSTDNTPPDLYSKLELKDFFERMFEETRKLCSTKRKIIKTALLNSVCKAEEDVEAGMLCENCYATASVATTPIAPIERASTDDASEDRIERPVMRDKFNVLSLSDKRFVQNFRLSKEAFLYVLDSIDSELEQQRNYVIPNIVKLATALAILGQGSNQRLISSVLPTVMPRVTMFRCMLQVCCAIEKVLFTKHIEFPLSKAEQIEASSSFYSACGIPGVIGVVGGTRIEFTSIYNTYKQGFKYSINAMVICDHKMRIRAVDSRWYDSHDSQIWNLSTARKYLRANFENGESGVRILGDSGYPLEPWLLTPYRNAAENTEEHFFNEQFSKGISLIEGTLAVLRGRFRCLLKKEKRTYAPKKAVQIINACCVLHNICISYKVEKPAHIVLERNNTSIAHADLEDSRDISDIAKNIRERLKNNMLNSRNSN